MIIWLTGLPASGKTTLAYSLYTRNQILQLGKTIVILDGDEVRDTISADLGFSEEDRLENNRRVISLAKTISQNDVTVVVSLISPYRSMRDFARRELKGFIEVWVKCSLGECIRRDPKGLYVKALSGEITNLTGLQDPYEEPLNPDVVVDTELETVDACVDRIMSVI